MTDGCIPIWTTASAFGIVPMGHLLTGTTIITNMMNKILITISRCCGPGTLFDDVNHICNFPWVVNCGDRPMPGSTRL